MKIAVTLKDAEGNIRTVIAEALVDPDELDDPEADGIQDPKEVAQAIATLNRSTVMSIQAVPETTLTTNIEVHDTENPPHERA